MIREQVYIEKPLSEVWDYIVLEFAKIFKCSPSQLAGKTIESTTRTFSGQEVKITQSIAELVPYESIILVSENSRDIVKMAYEFSADDENGTFLSTYEDGEGKSSHLRSWNYKLMTFPILKRSTVKRLRQRLETIKGILEGTLNFDEAVVEEESEGSDE